MVRIKHSKIRLPEYVGGGSYEEPSLAGPSWSFYNPLPAFVPPTMAESGNEGVSPAVPEAAPEPRQPSPPAEALALSSFTNLLGDDAAADFSLSAPLAAAPSPVAAASPPSPPPAPPSTPPAAAVPLPPSPPAPATPTAAAVPLPPSPPAAAGSPPPPPPPPAATPVAVPTISSPSSWVPLQETREAEATPSSPRKCAPSTGDFHPPGEPGAVAASETPVLAPIPPVPQFPLPSFDLPPEERLPAVVPTSLQGLASSVFAAEEPRLTYAETVTPAQCVAFDAHAEFEYQRILGETRDYISTAKVQRVLEGDMEWIMSDEEWFMIDVEEYGMDPRR